MSTASAADPEPTGRATPGSFAALGREGTRTTDAAGFVGEAVTLDWPEPDIARATLTRGPAMNTLTLALLAEFGRALDEAVARRARALIVTGSGRAFCCGAHLPYFTDPASPFADAPLAIREDYVGPIGRLFDRLEAMPFPTIAAVNGFALGGGCELALACDLRVLSADATLGLPEVHVGALPGAGGVQKLARFVGRGRALELILLGRRLEAEEALSLGLATAVAPPAELDQAVSGIVERLRRGGPLAIAYAKAMIYRCEGTDLRTARETGLDAVTVLAGSPEWREGMAAFGEKRPPRFE